jgi:hypothetical protein
MDKMTYKDLQDIHIKLGHWPHQRPREQPKRPEMAGSSYFL